MGFEVGIGTMRSKVARCWITAGWGGSITLSAESSRRGDEYRGGVVVSGWGFSVGEEFEYRGVDDAIW